MERRREQNRLAQRRFRQRRQDNGRNGSRHRSQMPPTPSIEASSTTTPPPPSSIPPTEMLTPTSPANALATTSTTSSKRSSCDLRYGSNLLLDMFALNTMDNLGGSPPELDSSTTASLSSMLTEQPFLRNTTPSLAPYSTHSYLDSASGGPSGAGHHSFRSGGGVGGIGDGRAESGWASSLHLAAQKGHDEIVRVLLQHSADCNVPDSEGRTPLVCATIGGHKDVVALLLAGGALLSCVDSRHRSALHWAVVHRRDSLLKLLLSHRHGEEQTPTQAVIDGYDLHGQTPLHLAIEADFEAGVRMLLQFGANINLVARRSSLGP